MKATDQAALPLAGRVYYACMHAKPEAARVAMCGALYLLLCLMSWRVYKRCELGMQPACHMQCTASLKSIA